jgi:hypothetical protein
MKYSHSFVFGLAVLLAFPISQSAEAKKAKPSSLKCSVVSKQVKKKGLHYAFARNKADRKGGYACGHSWGYPSVSAARKEALRFCLREEKIPPPIGVRGTCRIIFSK